MLYPKHVRISVHCAPEKRDSDTKVRWSSNKVGVKKVNKFRF